jgi:hypothetical protein
MNTKEVVQQQQQQQQQQEEAPAHKIIHTLDALYDQCTVPAAVWIIVLYLAPLPDWRAWLIHPVACLLFPLLFSQFILACHRWGLLKWVYNFLRAFVNGALMRIFLGVEKLRESKLGQICLWLSLINLVGFVGWYLYENVDLFQVLGKVLALWIALWQSLSDPVALLKSFQDLLKSLHAYRWLETIRLYYVGDMERMIHDANPAVFFIVLFVSMLLFCAAWSLYWCANHVLARFRKNREQQQKIE